MSDVAYWYVTFGFILSINSPSSVVALFALFDVSVAVPASILIAILPLQSEYSLS